MDVELLNVIQDAQYLSAVNSEDKSWFKHRKLPVLSDVEATTEIENTLREKGKLEFKCIYEEPLGRELFRQYCMNVLPVLKDRAPVMFEVQVESFRLQPKVDRCKIGQDIFKTFLKEESSAFIGAQQEEIEKIEKLVSEQNFEMELFDDVQSINIAKLEEQHFAKFLSSRFYTRYLQWKKLSTEPVSELHFDIYRVLGRGGFGDVYACRKKDSGRMYAVKMLNKKRMKKDNGATAFQERKVLAAIESRFVCSLKYAYVNKREVCLVLDLLQGGSLQYHLYQEGRFREKRVQFYLAHICCGIEDMHRAGFVYRDLKPENVLLDEEGFLKISDLGLAASIHKARKTKGKVGTSGYLAPEMILGEKHGFCNDWWSFGCCMFKMLTGRSPFRNPGNGEDDGSEGINKRTCELELEYLPKYFSPDAKDLCSRLLERDVSKRIGCGGFENAEGAKEIQDHPWFSNFSWKDLKNGHITEAPFVPDRRIVNAEALADMRQAKNIKNVKITAEDEEKYADFPIIVESAWQKEMLESGVFHEVNNIYDQQSKRMTPEERKQMKKTKRDMKDLYISNPILNDESLERSYTV